MGDGEGGMGDVRCTSRPPSRLAGADSGVFSRHAAARGQLGGFPFGCTTPAELVCAVSRAFSVADYSVLRYRIVSPS